LDQGASAGGSVKQGGVKRFALIGLALLVALGCAACGGGSKQAAASHGLPASLVKRIQAAVREPSPITGIASAKTVMVYGPASHLALERASTGPRGSYRHLSGAWYLIVVRGHFAGNLPVPPGGNEPHARIAMEVWSPQAAAGRVFGFANRLPKAVSGLKGPTVIDLSQDT
jgi:hypothetical protein